MNLINNLPDLVLCFVFSYLTAFERICKVSRVCKRWHSLIKSSSQVWKCVNFAWQRKITSEVLETYVFPGSTKVLLDECCYLKWEDLCVILKQCKRLEVLSLSWIGFDEAPVPLELITELKISQLRYLNLSHCTLSDKLFNAIALKCEVLSVLILQDSRGISQEAFKTSCFKSHRYLELINVAYITEALAFSCVLDLLEYNNCTVQLDIRGHHLSELEIDSIERAYPTASARIVEIDDYRHMLY